MTARNVAITLGNTKAISLLVIVVWQNPFLVYSPLCSGSNNENAQSKNPISQDPTTSSTATLFVIIVRYLKGNTMVMNLSKISTATMIKLVVKGKYNVSTILQLAPFDSLSISELMVISVTTKLRVNEDAMSHIIKFAMKKY